MSELEGEEDLLITRRRKTRCPPPYTPVRRGKTILTCAFARFSSPDPRFRSLLLLHMTSRSFFFAPARGCRVNSTPSSASVTQAPTVSKKDVKDLKNYKAPHFYAQDGAMVFKMAGDGARSELRFIDEWSVASSRTRRMVGQVSLPRPSSQMEQFTWMQVHGGSKGKKPLLRLSWHRKRTQYGKRLSNVLLATVRLNNRSGTSWGRGVGGRVAERRPPRVSRQVTGKPRGHRRGEKELRASRLGPRGPRGGEVWHPTDAT